MIRHKTILAAVLILLFAGTALAAQGATQTEGELSGVIHEIAELRNDLADMENRILADGSDDLLQDELRNLEFEQRIQALGERLLEIERRFLADEKPGLLEGAVTVPPTPDSQRATLELLRIEEMIALAKGELAAAWQESSLIQQKLTLELKREISETLANEPPDACFAPSTDSPESGEAIEFIDCSADPDGKITRWRWTFDDGTTSNEANPTHAFPGPGTYRATLEVTDDKGATSEVSRQIEVLPAPPTACFEAPEEVLAGTNVAFADCSTDPDGEIVRWAWSFDSAQGSDEVNPDHVFQSPGTYRVTLRVTDDQGLSDSIQREIVVRSATGRLHIVPSEALLASRGPVPKDVLLVLDLSSSMGEELDGRPKIEIAKAVLREIISELPDSSSVGFRTFKGCGNSELLVPLQPLNRAALNGAVDGLRTGSRTPLAYTIDEIAKDLRGIEGPHLVIFVTDGMETCDGDPVASAQALVAAGIDVLFKLVGYDVQTSDGQSARRQLLAIAAATDGDYIDAQSTAELLEAIRSALPLVFRVLDADGQLVKEGVVGGTWFELPAGSYSIIVETDPQLVLEDVIIGSDEEVIVTVSYVE